MYFSDYVPVFLSIIECFDIFSNESMLGEENWKKSLLQFLWVSYHAYNTTLDWTEAKLHSILIGTVEMTIYQFITNNSKLIIVPLFVMYTIHVWYKYFYIIWARSVYDINISFYILLVG